MVWQAGGRRRRGVDPAVFAENQLGEYYRDGRGVGQDYGQAAAWFRKAADEGFGDSQLSLGRLFAAGRGVPQDPVEAYKRLTLVEDGFPRDANRTAAACRAREVVAANMTPAQIGRAQELVAAWQPLP